MAADPSVVSDILGLGKLGEKSLDIAQKFAERIFGPAADEFGELIADPVRALRERRQQRARSVIETAAAMAGSSAESVHQVPDRLLIPLLEQASLEDDEFLVDRWGTLLATAATTTQVLPAFVAILSELSSAEVRCLSRLRELERSRSTAAPFTPQWGPAFESHYRESTSEALLTYLGLAGWELDILRINLRRLGLVRVKGSQWILTVFGNEFIKACTKPIGRKEEPSS